MHDGPGEVLLEADIRRAVQLSKPEGPDDDLPDGWRLFVCTALSKWGPTSLHLLVVVPGNPLGLCGTEGLRERQIV